MNSTENTGAVGQLYAALAPALMERAIQQGVEAGVKAGLEQIEAQQRKARKDRYDRRLHNTRLLLKNYRNFKHYAQGAVSDAAQAEESAADLLETLDGYEHKDRLYIESIKQSQRRTFVILAHIDKMLAYYKAICEQTGRQEDIRRYKVVMAFFVEEPEKSAQEVAGTFSIDRRTVYKDIAAAMKPLTALIFGIDGLRME